MIHTPLCDLVGIEYPVFQGGMAHISDGRLAAAVSEAGGLGIISAYSGAEPLREQIRIARGLTKKPIGVNVMLMSPAAGEVARVIAEEKVEVVTTGAGNPAEYMPLWLEAGCRVIPVVASAALAKMMERCGACAVIAEGGESGGHIGEAATMPLVPQVVDAVSIPVIAAGGIADGRGLAASLMLGAVGVQIGTRFLTAHECSVHPHYKALVLKAADKLMPYLVYDSTEYRMKELAQKFQSYTFTGIREIEGESKVGPQFMEFHADEDSIWKLVIELICTPKVGKK